MLPGQKRGSDDKSGEETGLYFAKLLGGVAGNRRMAKRVEAQTEGILRYCDKVPGQCRLNDPNFRDRGQTPLGTKSGRSEESTPHLSRGIESIAYWWLIWGAASPRFKGE